MDASRLQPEEFLARFLGTPETAAYAPGEAVAIDSLSLDPANARKHPEKNLSVIAASLRRFGQQKPIVVDADGIVRAGNGTLATAKSLGWTHIAVYRTHLRGSEATAFALADNRAAELADWDPDILGATIEGLELEGFEGLGDLGLGDLGELGLEEPSQDEAAAESPAIQGRFDILVICGDETKQSELLARLMGEGYECKSMIL